MGNYNVLTPSLKKIQRPMTNEEYEVLSSDLTPNKEDSPFFQHVHLSPNGVAYRLRYCLWKDSLIEVSVAPYRLYKNGWSHVSFELVVIEVFLKRPQEVSDRRMAEAENWLRSQNMVNGLCDSKPIYMDHTYALEFVEEIKKALDEYKGNTKTQMRKHLKAAIEKYKK